MCRWFASCWITGPIRISRRYFGSPLSQACWNDGFEAAELLIDRGAKVNARDAVADFTPLHWAAGSETLRPDLVKLLLASGADPNAAGGEPVERVRTGAADPAVDRREARPDGDRRGARGRRRQGAAAAGEDRHAASHAPGRTRRFDGDRLGREGVGGVANDRGQIARGVPPARQQTRLRLVPPAVLADGRRGPRPEPVHPLRPGGRQGTDRLGRQPQRSVRQTRVRRPNPLSSGRRSHVWLRVAWFRRRRGSAERPD